jgi:cysteine desulfurase / selenocysteine lyase
MNREDFPLLKNNIIYFDNSATTLKPKVVIDKTLEYYNNYSANAHRGDYDMSLKVDDEYEETRNLVKEFINAKLSSEVIFNSGTTEGLNTIIFGYFSNILKANDEVITTKTEHSALLLPLYELQERIGIKIKYIDLDTDNKITLENLKKQINSNTKLIAIAHITNTIGDERPIKEIISLAHSNNILVLLDVAQSISHLKLDVQALDVDFMTFSAHKMYGPTGVGVLYGKYDLLKNVKPIFYGGGMNSTFNSLGERVYHNLPTLLEAGTRNIAGIIAFKESIKYLNDIGLSVIHQYELSLKEYLLKELKSIEDIIIYNENSESSIVLFNHKSIFAQDIAVYLNKHNICVRAGNHCAKLIEEVLDVKNTCRISLSFYNTKEEIDILIKALNYNNIKEEIIY